MKIRNVCSILLSCAVCLTSCAGKEDRSYLHSLITEEQTLLCGNYTENRVLPTEEDIYYDLTGMDIDFSLDDYAFEKAAENAEGLLYYVNALSPDVPDFKVYQIEDFYGITCTRDFLAKATKEAENGLRGKGVTYGVQIGHYNIGKMNIQENDTEIVFNLDGASAFLEIADSQLCAEMEFQRRKKGYFDLNQYEQDSADVSSELYYNEYAVITYKLTVMGE